MGGEIPGWAAIRVLSYPSTETSRALSPASASAASAPMASWSCPTKIAVGRLPSFTSAEVVAYALSSEVG